MMQGMADPFNRRVYAAHLHGANRRHCDDDDGEEDIGHNKSDSSKAKWNFLFGLALAASTPFQYRKNISAGKINSLRSRKQSVLLSSAYHKVIH
jgi:hypothetical protein